MPPDNFAINKNDYFELNNLSYNNIMFNDYDENSFDENSFDENSFNENCDKKYINIKSKDNNKLLDEILILLKKKKYGKKRVKSRNVDTLLYEFNIDMKYNNYNDFFKINKLLFMNFSTKKNNNFNHIILEKWNRYVDFVLKNKEELNFNEMEQLSNILDLVKKKHREDSDYLLDKIIFLLTNKLIRKKIINTIKFYKKKIYDNICLTSNIEYLNILPRKYSRTLSTEYGYGGYTIPINYLLKLADIYGADNVYEIWDKYKKGISEEVYSESIDKRRDILKVFFNLDNTLDNNLNKFVSSYNSNKLEELCKSKKRKMFINFKKKKCINKIEMLIIEN